MPRLFVYGTLRQGFVNHYLIQYSQLIEEDVTLEGYEIRYNLSTSYPFPYAFFKLKSKIRGDIYEVDEKIIIDKIDPLEGVDEGHYIRHYDMEREVFIYVKAIDNRQYFPLIISGDWREFFAANRLSYTPGWLG